MPSNITLPKVTDEQRRSYIRQVVDGLRSIDANKFSDTIAILEGDSESEDAFELARNMKEMTGAGERMRVKTPESN